MTERSRGTIVRYAQAVAAVVVAAVARVALDPVLGDGQPLATFLLALAIVATASGFGPAMAVMAGTFVAYPLIYHAPRHSFALPSHAGWIALSSFVLLGTAVAAMCSALRFARKRAEAGQEDLRREMARRERAELDLRDRETRWHALIENSSDAITMFAPDRSILYVSGSIAKITGATSEELIGTSMSGSIHPADRRAVDRAWDEVLARPGAVASAEFRVRHRDGSWRSVENVATNHLDNPAIGAIVVNTRDVTERAATEEAVRRSEALLLALADSMPQMVWAARPDGYLEYYNKRWFEFTGLSEEQSYSIEGWTQIVHPDDLGRCLETWSASIRTGEPYQIEYRFRDRVQGGYRWQLGRALPVRDVSGQIVRWYGTCTDIDDQKRAESAADAANQAKNRFLAVLGHELRTPLTPILLTVSSLLDDPSANLGETEPALDLIRRNVALESRLIDDLLDVTRIVRGTFSLAVEPCDVHALIALALEICRADLEAAGVAVSLDFSAPDPRVLADPSRVQQVFWNLIKNAAKFSPGGGAVTIRTRDDPGAGRLVIEVADSGVGIAPEFLAKVFEAFEQGETSPWTREFGGLGLGLAISRAIVSAHSGEITAASEGPGRGATFRVALPTVAGRVPPRVEADSPVGEPTPRSPLRILLIEDDPTTLAVLSRLLRLSRHEVTTADCVSAALEAADRQHDEFDLIISDIGLPDGNGMDLMRVLQARRKFPAIALTGFGTDDDIRRSRDAGFATHLIKPVDFRTLEAAIRQLVPRNEPAGHR